MTYYIILYICCIKILDSELLFLLYINYEANNMDEIPLSKRWMYTKLKKQNYIKKILFILVNIILILFYYLKNETVFKLLVM